MVAAYGLDRLSDVEDDAGGESLQRVAGVVDAGELAGAVFDSRCNLPACEGEVGTELGLVGEGARTMGSVLSEPSMRRPTRPPRILLPLGVELALFSTMRRASTPTWMGPGVG